jgi:hypothetical protein
MLDRVPKGERPTINFSCRVKLSRVKASTDDG